MKKALLLIDIQKSFLDKSWGERNNIHAEDNAEMILKKFRESNDLVIHINHKSDNEDSRFYFKKEGFKFNDKVKPEGEELVISKSVNSAFIGTNLKEILDINKVEKLVIVGISTPHCVSTTTRMAANYGYKVYLVEDATTSFALSDHHGKLYSPQEIQHITIATLHEEFATILSTRELLKNYNKI